MGARPLPLIWDGSPSLIGPAAAGQTPTCEPIDHGASLGSPKCSIGLAALRAIVDEQLLAPRSHAGELGRRDRDAGDEVGRVLEVEVALEQARLRRQSASASGTLI